MTTKERRRQAFLGEDPPLGSEGWRERVRMRAETTARMKQAAGLVLAICERGEFAGWRPAPSKLRSMRRTALALEVEADRWAAEIKAQPRKTAAQKRARARHG